MGGTVEGVLYIYIYKDAQLRDSEFRVSFST